ncbi:MAG: hypothetical protein FWF28_11215 [Micrococcales bacterium]|nr:hypothetical protein [Micrococcales bacterium]
MTDDITQMLRAAGCRDNMLRPADLRAIWTLLPGAEAASQDLFDDFENAVLWLCPPQHDDGAAGDSLGLRVGHWTIDLSKAAIQATLGTALTAGALIMVDPTITLTDLGVAVVAGVLPAVLTIERLELSPKEKKILADLRCKPEVVDKACSSDQLYEALPEETRAQINRLDFMDIVERLRAIGDAQGNDAGLIKIRP